MSSRRPLLWLFSLLAIGAATWLTSRFVSRGPTRAAWPSEVHVVDVLAMQRFDGAVSPTLPQWLSVVDPYRHLTDVLTLADDAVALRLAETHMDLRMAEPTRGPTRRGLNGMRVLLDPGHFGGAWAQIEHRLVQTPGLPPVREGDLTYATARLAQQLLEAKGAVVTLTRGAPPSEPFDPTRQPVDLEREAALLLDHDRGNPLYQAYFAGGSASEAVRALEILKRDLVRTDPFALFNRFNLRQRAELARHLSADLFVSIHYNTSREGLRNGVVVFVPGNVLPEEGESMSARFYTARRLIDGSMAASAATAFAVVSAMQDEMGLGLLPRLQVPEGDTAFRLPIQGMPGVYARNLAVLRRAPVPALLAEGPCMNVPSEARALTAPVGAIDGVPYPARAMSYAAAIARGVEEAAPEIWAWRAAQPQLH